MPRTPQSEILFSSFVNWRFSEVVRQVRYNPQDGFPEGDPNDWHLTASDASRLTGSQLGGAFDMLIYFDMLDTRDSDVVYRLINQHLKDRLPPGFVLRDHHGLICFGEISSTVPEVWDPYPA